MAKSRNRDPGRQISRGGPVQVQVHRETFSGPIPDPVNMARYREVYDDAPRIIFEMAREEQAFRHEMGRRGMDIRSRGQLIAAGLMSMFAFIAAGLLLMGRDLAAFQTLLVAVAPFAIAFLYLRHENAKDTDRE